MLPRPDLADHQRSGIQWIQDVGRGLLADEPGLGKSRTAIEAFDGGKVLVIAPSMVIAGGTWSDELDRWANYPDRFEVAPYSRLNARNGNSVNFGTKKNPSYRLRDEYKQRYDAVVVDECHYTKGRSTSWTWATEQIAKRSGALLEMSGTPMPNWAHELYTVLRALRPEDAKPGSPLGSYWRWVYQWFRVDASQYREHEKVIGGLLACGDSWVCAHRPPADPCEHYQQFVEANLGRQFLRRLRDDVLTDLPPITEQQVETPMDAAQAKMYRDLKRDYLTNTPQGLEVVAWTPGSRNVLLDRVTTSAWFLDHEGSPRGGKLDRLRFDLENRSAPTLVLAHYQESVDACAEVARATGARVGTVHGGVSKKSAAAAVAGFKGGKLDVLCGSLETLAEGLTLTVADMAIFVETSYKPSRNEQAKRRIHRMGQTRPVTVLDYVTPGTVDAHKRKLLQEKTDQQIRVLTAASLAALL